MEKQNANNVVQHLKGCISSRRDYLIDEVRSAMRRIETTSQYFKQPEFASASEMTDGDLMRMLSEVEQLARRLGQHVETCKETTQKMQATQQAVDALNFEFKL